MYFIYFVCIDFISMDIKTKISIFVIASITVAMSTASISSFAFATLIAPENTDVGLEHVTEALQALKAGDLDEANMHLTEALELF
jgi:hypothetical protein